MIRKLFCIAFVLFLFAFSSAVVFADHGEDDATHSGKTKKTIEYTMVYPGLLPDNPFYALKMVRDKFVSLLISDALKRAEFDLLQADKRIGAGIFLVNKDTQKANLALSTIAKGQQYMRKALDDAVLAKRQGYTTKLFTAKAYLASQKQQEILLPIEKRLPKNQIGYYNAIMKEQTALINRAKALSQKDQAKK